MTGVAPGRMLLLLVSVALMNLIVSPVYGLINIKSQPAKVVNGNYVQLVCDVGTMENTVKWVYGGVTYFSCDPPYTNCFTNSSIRNNGYDFSINDDSLIVILLVSKNQNDGNWSCYHGNEKANIEIDNADAPQIIYFSSNSSEGAYQLKCKIESQVPADVVIYSQNYQGVRRLYEMNKTGITEHGMTTSLLCEDYILVCNASNGYGPTISKYRYMNTDCPLKILNKLSTNTLTFNKTVTGTRLELKVYFEGGSNPTQSLHHYTTDGFQMVLSRASLTQYPQPSTYEPPHVVIAFRHIDESDAGKYVFTLHNGEKQTPVVVKLFVITLVYTGKTPSRGSDEPATPTTPKMTVTLSSGGTVVGKTKAENTIMFYMVYLGVTLSVYFGSIE